MSEFRFERFEDFSSWAEEQPSAVSVTHTTRGFVFLTCRGEVVAHVSKKLRGSTVQETAANLAAVNLTVGIPPAEENGERGLPTLMEDQSTWESVAL